MIALSRRPLKHVMTFAFEQRLVGSVAIEHLAERGHRHVLALLPTDPELVELGRVRLDGAYDAAARHGVTVTPTVDLAEGLATGADRRLRVQRRARARRASPRCRRAWR